MASKAVRRPTNRPERSVYSRPVGGPSVSVCKFWAAGRCTKANCRFLHPDAPPTPVNPYILNQKKGLVWRKEETATGMGNACNATQRTISAPDSNPYQKIASPKTPYDSILTTKEGTATGKINACNATQKTITAPKINPSQSYVSEKSPDDRTLTVKEGTDAGKGNAWNVTENSNSARASPKSPEKVCKFWVDGNCVKGDRCAHLHKWFRGEGLSMLAKLEGHKKAVTGIVLPERTSKLYSAGKDGEARIWDCHTGQCVSVINLGGEAGSLISEGPWVFVGVPNLVKAWNTQSNAEFNLDGPVGQVHGMAVGNDMVLAGAQDGVIYVWKGCSETNQFKPAATLKGHTGAVVCVTVGRNRIYSGSVDQTIKVWDLNTLQCLMTLDGHSGAVMSLICWEQFLLSCSLDNTIKVWAATEGGSVKVNYTHNVGHGVLDLAGINSETKPILLCSCNDNSVRLYELPSFIERARLFTKQEARAIQVGPGGLIFSGDATGLVSVWNWMEPGLKVESS